MPLGILHAWIEVGATIKMPELIAKVIRTRDFGKGMGEGFIKDFFACPAWEEGVISSLKKAGIMDEVFAITLTVHTREDAEGELED